VADAARQGLDVAMRRLGAAIVVFGLADAVRLELGRMVVDEELALAHLDAIAGQADDALDPGLRAVARPAEHHDIAALRRAAEEASGLRQRDLDRQRGRAIAVGIFRGQ